MLMVSVHDHDAKIVIASVAETLKKEMQAPEWSRFVKTGVSRERSPEQDDWWFTRAASMLRRIYTDGPIGVSKLRSYYGGRHRRGHKQAHFKKGSGKVARVLLQELEKLGYIEKTGKPVRGRTITAKGRKLVDNAVKGR